MPIHRNGLSARPNRCHKFAHHCRDLITGYVWRHLVIIIIIIIRLFNIGQNADALQ